MSDTCVKGVWETYDGQVKQMREQGLSLQAIGDNVGVTRERVRQILRRHYGTTESKFVSRERLAKFLGCSDYLLARLEERGALSPLHSGGRYLYSPEEAEGAVERLIEHLTSLPVVVERICESCGRRFSVRPYRVRHSSPARFCSNKCKGMYVGVHYGFRARPENGRFGLKSLS